jgi:glycosyltransferase involved in cell wall biosynthesis
MYSIIILTQYYPPETGAPQNRLHSLAKYIHKSGVQVHVMTSMPNYPKNEIYEAYRGRYAMSENIEDITVHRRWIFVSASRGVAARLLNYFSFVVTSFFALLRMPRADYLLCESPPLFLGWTAVIISKIKGSRLVFNVSDLWPESAEKLQIISNRFLIQLAYRLEHWIYKNAWLISGQTKGIVKSISERFPMKKVVWFPNGVDLDFFEGAHESVEWRSELGIHTDNFVLLYAGIIGYAQGLDVILQAATKVKEMPITFLIVGDGPEKERLIKLSHEMELSNVIFQGNLQKSKIPGLIKSCDAYIVPLKKLDLFKGAIPSKLFEPLSLGKPILLGVDGEARELFIEEGNAGLYYEPENAEELIEKIKTLYADRNLKTALGKNGQQYVKVNFDRNQIHARFLKHLAIVE